MPFVGSEFVRLNPAEGEEEHSKYQQRLDNGNNMLQRRACEMHRLRHIVICQICQGSRKHRNGEHILLDDVLKSFHFAFGPQSNNIPRRIAKIFAVNP